MNDTLAGKSILLTGASRGIGRALALKLAEHRVSLALLARSADDLEAVAAEARGKLAQAVHVLPVDLAEPHATLRAFHEAKDRMGGVDVLINNAGYNSRRAHLHEVELDEWDGLVAVNLRAPWLLGREAMREMIPRGSGHIMNVLSTACLHSIETMGAYTACKMGLMGLTKVLIKEARRHGIKITAAYPGGTDTKLRYGPETPYLTAETTAELLVHALLAPGNAVVQEIVFRPLVETNY